VVGSRRNWFTIISFLGLFNGAGWTFMPCYQRASVLWFAKYWQPVVVYTRQERGFSQNTSRNSGGCFHFLSVWIWCFLLHWKTRTHNFMWRGLHGSLATGVKCFLVYVYLFSVLTEWLILSFRLQFWIHISRSCCPVIFTLHLLISFCPSFFFTFISGFIVSFLCFSSLYFSDILCSLFNCFLLLFIS